MDFKTDADLPVEELDALWQAIDIWVSSEV